jgi:hypothetical protein
VAGIEGFEGEISNGYLEVASKGLGEEVQYREDKERHAENKLILFCSLKNYI